MNPLLAPISHYVYQPAGYPMVLLGSLLLAGCGMVIAADLIRRSTGQNGRDDRRRRWAAGLLISFAVALTLVGLFPTDPAGSVTISASAVIHRIGAAWSFLSLPVAGVLVARTASESRSTSGRALVRVAAGLLAAVVIFLSIHLPLAFAGSGIPAFGLLERIGFAFMIGYLILLAAALRSAPVDIDPPAATNRVQVSTAAPRPVTADSRTQLSLSGSARA